MVEFSATFEASSKRVGTLVFLAGFCVYAALQCLLPLYPVFARSVPLWPVDAYTYMAKAEQMRSCFLQECPALGDLRQQLEPNPDAEINWRRGAAYHRVLYIYHPLHSALVAALRGAGLAWEAAYNGIAILGQALLVCSAAYFLGAVWGRGAAGLALFFLAAIVFPGFHGVHWIVPSNMALAIALLTWAAILHSRHYRHAALPVGVVAMLAMHPAGQVYAGVAILLYLAVTDRGSRTTWLVAGAGVIAVVLYLALPYVITRPEFGFWKHPPPSDWTIWRGLRANLTTAWGMFTDWSRRYGGPATLILVLALGLITVPEHRRRRPYVVGGLLAGVTTASLLYVLPRYPAEVFSRVWIPLVFFATGAIGQAAWFWITRTVATILAVCRDARESRIATPAVPVPGRRALPGVLIVGALLLYAMTLNATIGARSLTAKLVDLYQGSNNPLDLGQPARVLARLGPGQRLVYMDELPMYFYLLRGGLDHGAVYYPAVAGSSIEPRWLDRSRNIRYVVAPHDIGPLRHKGRLALTDETRVELWPRQGIAWQDVALNLENLGGRATLAIFPAGGGDGATPGHHHTLMVPARWSGWMRLAVPPSFAARAIRIAPVSLDAVVMLRGLRLGREHGFAWPWDQGVTLRYGYRKQVTMPAGHDSASAPAWRRSDRNMMSETSHSEIGVARFDSRRLIPPSCESLGVVEDKGMTVAIAVSCRAPR